MFKVFNWFALLILTIWFGCHTDAQERAIVQGDSYDIDINATPLYHVVLTKDVTYGDVDDVTFAISSGIEVDRNNRVFIAGSSKIMVFSEDGDIIKIMGGRGRGPGEFESFSLLDPKIGEERLFVYDEILRRINVYDVGSLTFQKSILIDPIKWRAIPALKKAEFEGFFVLNDSTLFVRFEDYLINHEDKHLKTNYYLMNLDGDVYSEKIFSHTPNTLHKGGIQGPIKITNDFTNDSPFPNASTRSTLLTVDDEWNIYSVWTNDFRVKVQNIRSGICYDIFYPFENTKLNPDDIISLYEGNERMYQRVKREDFLATWPAVDYFIVDDENRIWIATITAEEHSFEWWIISRDGEVISKFNWPGKRLQRHRAPYQIQAVRNGYLYAREENEDTGQVKFVRYKIEFEAITNE